MKLLCDVCHDRVESQLRWGDPCKFEGVWGVNEVRLTGDRISKRNVEVESLSVELSCQLAFTLEPEAVVLDAHLRCPAPLHSTPKEGGMNAPPLSERIHAELRTPQNRLASSNFLLSRLSASASPSTSPKALS